MNILGTRLSKKVAQTDLVGFKKSPEIQSQAHIPAFRPSSVARCSTRVASVAPLARCLSTELWVCSREGDTKYTNGIVTQQLMKRITGEPQSDSTLSEKSATVAKNVRHLGCSAEPNERMSPRTKRSLAVTKTDRLGSPSSPA